MTKKQKELAEKHGTPEQFEKAIWKAYSDLFITKLTPAAVERSVKTVLGMAAAWAKMKQEKP